MVININKDFVALIGRATNIARVVRTAQVLVNDTYEEVGENKLLQTLDSLEEIEMDAEQLEEKIDELWNSVVGEMDELIADNSRIDMRSLAYDLAFNSDMDGELETLLDELRLYKAI